MTSVQEASNHEEEEEEDELQEWFLFHPQKPRTDRVVTHLTFDASTRIIPKASFQGHDFLCSVKILRSIKTIGKQAFCTCESLSNVEFSDHGNLQTIGNYAFQGCMALQQARMPNTVRVIGEGAFQWCLVLTNVHLPSGLKVLRADTFSGCRALTEMELPDGLLKIEERAFRRCESLLEIKIPHSVKVIGKRAFEECRSLNLVELPKRLKKIDQCTFAYCDRLGGIALPDSLTEIGIRAFVGCKSLLGIEFADISHVKIQMQAFWHCRSLVNVCLPCSVEENVKGAPLFARCVMKTASCMAGGSSSRSSSSPDINTPFALLYQLYDKNVELHLQDRYAQLPIHSLCYHASVTTVDDLKQALAENQNWEWQDCLGMTPFHVVATSANPRVDLLECLWSTYPAIDFLAQKDNRENTMMDYLLKHTRGLEMLQMILRRVFLDERLWTFGEAQHQDAVLYDIIVLKKTLNNQIESLAECVDSTTKRERMRDIFETVGFHSRTEVKTLLELASWKRRVMQVQEERAPPVEGMDREICRYQSEAEVLIENVTGFLWGKESRCYTALAVFPLFTLETKQDWRTIFDIFLPPQVPFQT